MAIVEVSVPPRDLAFQDLSNVTTATFLAKAIAAGLATPEQLNEALEQLSQLEPDIIAAGDAALQAIISAAIDGGDLQLSVDALVDGIKASVRGTTGDLTSSPLLVGETAGFVADFTQAQRSRQAVKKTGGVATLLNADDVFVNARTANQPPMVRNTSGDWIFAPTNLFLNSSAPATQDVTDTIEGMSYYFAVGDEDTGDLTLSGAVTGVVDKDNPLVAVSTGGTVTATKSGTLSRMQMSYGDQAVAYLATAGAIRYGLPISYNPDNARWELLLAMTSTNYFPDSPTPATSAVSLPAADWAVSVVGSGSVEVSGGRGTATDGDPVYFTLASTTSVTFVVTGSPDHVQVEPRAHVTPPIFNYGTGTSTRENSLITAGLSSDLGLTLGSAYGIYAEYACDSWSVTADTPQTVVFTLYGAAGESLFLNIDAVTNQARVQMLDGSVVQDSFGPARAQADQVHEWTCRVKAGSLLVSMDGLPSTLTNACTGTNTSTLPTVTTLRIAPDAGQFATIRLLRLAIFPRELKASEVISKTRTSTIDPDDTPYAILLAPGQSQKNAGADFDPAIDLSHPRIDVLDLKTAAATVGLAQEPLPVIGAFTVDRIGHDQAFLRDHVIPNNGLRPGQKALILPANASGQGFGGFNSNPRFNPGNDLYNVTAAAYGWAKAKYPNSVPLGIVHAAFDNEAYTGGTEPQWTASQVEDAQEAFVSALRDEVGANVPYICTGLTAPTISSNAPGAALIETALQEVADRTPNSAYVETSDLDVVNGETHLNAASQRTLAGRIWEVFQNLYQPTAL